MRTFRSVLPKVIQELILFEFSGDAMREFLCTEVANRFSTEIRAIIMPSYEQRRYLRYACVFGMGWVYVSCLYGDLHQKERKSRKYLHLVDYEDFPRLHHVLVKVFLAR